MPDIEVDVSIEVFCGRCGAGICGNTSVGRSRGRGQPYFQVSPCEKCLDEAEKTGYNKGYEDGEKDSQ